MGWWLLERIPHEEKKGGASLKERGGEFFLSKFPKTIPILLLLTDLFFRKTPQEDLTLYSPRRGEFLLSSFEFCDVKALLKSNF